MPPSRKTILGHGLLGYVREWLAVLSHGLLDFTAGPPLPKGVGRDWDTGDHRNTVARAHTVKTFVNGRLAFVSNQGPSPARAALIGSHYSDPTHEPNPLVTGSAKTFVEDEPLGRIGDLFACGAKVNSGSSNTLAEV